MASAVAADARRAEGTRHHARAPVSGPSKFERERRLTVEVGVLVRRVAERAGISHPWTEAELRRHLETQTRANQRLIAAVPNRR